MEEVHADDAPVFDLPFSQATVNDGTVYVSGQVPIDPETMRVVEGGIEAEARQTLDNIATILEAAGSSFDSVLKTQVYLTDMDDFDAFNAVYEEYVGDPRPARSAFAVDELAIDIAVEVDVVAAVED
ncbi:MAG: Rid family detoxifying hydrolase [Haloarculaceae archaeon]